LINEENGNRGTDGAVKSEYWEGKKEPGRTEVEDKLDHFLKGVADFRVIGFMEEEYICLATTIEPLLTSDSG
jgi:hypothetical protein